jgi:hypothetical protein
MQGRLALQRHFKLGGPGGKVLFVQDVNRPKGSTTHHSKQAGGDCYCGEMERMFCIYFIHGYHSRQRVANSLPSTRLNSMRAAASARVCRYATSTDTNRTRNLPLGHYIRGDEVMPPHVSESVLAQMGGELSTMIHAVEKRLRYHFPFACLEAAETYIFHFGPIFGAR